MTQIKKIETPSNKNWMEDLKNVIEANINSLYVSWKKILMVGRHI